MGGEWAEWKRLRDDEGCAVHRSVCVVVGVAQCLIGLVMSLVRASASGEGWCVSEAIRMPDLELFMPSSLDLRLRGSCKSSSSV